ncbi:MAG: GerMN domain-containing protein [Firmicutes bacterium]|nr:GerMN domain-containing protein [Bacillota bacterium]
MWKKFILAFVLLFVLGIIFGAAHEWRKGELLKSPEQVPPQDTETPPPEPPSEDDLPRADETKTITIYFGDGEAMYLIPEQRIVDCSEESWAETVVGELIRGPQQADRVKTVPPNAELRNLWVDDNGIAYVDFSREFQTDHWGGSAGDTFTLFSVVNSLTELEGIEAVQFLIEGETQEAILGHTDTTRPMGRREDLIRR